MPYLFLKKKKKLGKKSMKTNTNTVLHNQHSCHLCHLQTELIIIRIRQDQKYAVLFYMPEE